MAKTQAKMKQVLCIRTDLNMRKGKMVAQGAHASILSIAGYLTGEDCPQRVRNWLEDGMTKICVRVDTEDALVLLNNAAREAGLPVCMVVDAGNTEFHGVPTKTCLAIGPDLNEKIDSITKDLILL